MSSTIEHTRLAFYDWLGRSSPFAVLLSKFEESYVHDIELGPEAETIMSQCIIIRRANWRCVVECGVASRIEGNYKLVLCCSWFGLNPVSLIWR
jgi:hypothetical protein